MELELFKGSRSTFASAARFHPCTGLHLCYTPCYSHAHMHTHTHTHTHTHSRSRFSLGGHLPAALEDLPHRCCRVLVYFGMSSPLCQQDTSLFSKCHRREREKKKKQFQDVEQLRERSRFFRDLFLGLRDGVKTTALGLF